MARWRREGTNGGRGRERRWRRTTDSGAGQGRGRGTGPVEGRPTDGDGIAIPMTGPRLAKACFVVTTCDACRQQQRDVVRCAKAAAMRASAACHNPATTRREPTSVQGKALPAPPGRSLHPAPPRSKNLARDAAPVEDTCHAAAASLALDSARCIGRRPLPLLGTSSNDLLRRPQCPRA